MFQGDDFPFMDDGSRLPWLLAVLLLLCAAFLAVTETAFASASRPRLKAMADAGNAKAKKALSVLDDFDRAITTILILTNIVHLSTASIVTLTATRRWGLGVVTLSTLLTTVAVFFVGEMLPKSFAKKLAEPAALFCAGPISFFMRLLTPLSSLLTAIGEKVSATVRGEPELSVTEDELYDIIEDMTEEGTLDEQQGDLISSALQFGDLTAESVLTPRMDVVAVNVADSVASILAMVKGCKHSRLPVYEGSIDNIIGILPIRKFIKKYLRQGTALDVRSLLDAPLFVHQSAALDDLFPQMTRNRQSLAIVTDNFGGTLGLITIEDIVEELVGDIWDEDDVVEEHIIALPDGSFSVDADEKVADTFEQISFEDPEDDDDLVDTLLSAWAYERFSSIPSEGDSFDYHSLRVTVSKMDHNRIRRLKLLVLPTEAEGGAAE